jgi:hypothetical protein
MYSFQGSNIQAQICSLIIARGGGNVKDGKLNFQATSPFGDHTARLRRALICTGLCVHSLPRGKERTKKTRQDVPSWNSLGVAALQRESRKIKYNFWMLCSKSCHLARQAEKAKSFCKKFSWIGGVADSKNFLFLRLRATSVSVFFFKTPTQTLKMLIFASCCACARKDALRVSKGN